MGAPTFDLQSHSRCSDGSLAPADVVAAAADAGVELLALSDHDSVDGVDAALEAAAAHPSGIRVVAAVEISAVQPDHEDLHVLGYAIDHRSRELSELLAAARADRVSRGGRIAARLRELGFALDQTELDERRASGQAIGRPHLASAVLGHPGNAERLREEGTATLDAFFERYLVRGGEAFVPRPGPTVAEAVEWIHRAGGVAIWAHPFFDIGSTEDVLAAVDEFAGEGLDGVEAFYITHTEDQTRALAAHCAERNLLTTGSADFHGPDHPRFSRFRAFATYGIEPRLGPLA
jgi:predicted metal-dependent phosphoesterase TrpH